MNTLKKLAVSTCIACSLGVVGVQAQTQPNEKNMTQNAIKLPSGVTQGPTVEGITEYRLPNGLKVVLFPDVSKPTATVNMTYLVGSRNENYGETGMAHLLEHLIFKGSKKYPNPTKEFTDRGFRMNGSTWLDRTNYYVSFTATEDNLAFALDWSADAMRNSFIAKKDLDSEMSVVRNEYEMGENSPASVMMKRMQSMIYDWHNYGKSTIGNRSDIENVRIENLQGFYHRYYRPDNAVLTVSGKFDVQKTLDLIAKDFGSIENPQETLPPEWTVEPTADGERYFEIRRKGETQLVSVAYRIPSALHPDMPAVETAVDVLSDTPNGRLYNALVKSGLATNVFGYAIGAKAPGYVMFGAMVKKGEPLDKVKEVMIETIENTFKTTPISSTELDRAKTEEQADFERAFSDPESFGIGLSEYIALGDWRLFFYGRDAAMKVTSEQADKAAGRYFVRDNRVVGVFIPEDNPQRAVISQAPSAQEVLSTYQAKTSGENVAAFDTSFENLDKQTKRFEVANLKVALLPKQTRGQTVTVIMNFKWGDLKGLSNKGVIDSLSTAMLTRGTQELSREQIEDLFTKYKMKGSPTSFVTTKENLPKVLELVSQLYQQASYPQAEFDRLKKQTLVMMESSLDKPDALAQDAMASHFNTYPKGDPRYAMSLKEKIDALNKTSLKEVKDYHDQFMGTARGEIAIVGDFDAQQIEAEIKKDFANYKSRAPYQEIVKEFKPVKATRIVIDTPDKENATVVARSVFPMTDTDQDVAALKIANWILGGGTGLSNRLITRLRQQEGLSYGAGSGVIIPSHGNNASFVFRAIVAPQNMLKAEASAKDVIAKAVKDGFTDKEVEEAKKGFLQSQEVARAQDGVLAASWNEKLDKGRTWEFTKKLTEQVKNLTTDQVNAALRKYIKPDEITYILAGDQKKAQSK